ncbi:MAG: nucleotidyltransferase domain-containing protein [Candidatus Aenigmarchaeota archaeon]|nr:nucleotidyltransferase domain-containing protein [Candidatus Aenigmarchaeota archaeon]MDI6722141.1 nucleotidyltransferase domain-containing protein [Candidatus Aenigmarchaeota archaeon]
MQKVLEVFFRFPEKEFSLSDLAREAGVAKANIGRILDELEKTEMIDKVELSKIWRIKARQQSPNFRKTKIVRNLSLINQSGLVEFLTIMCDNPKAIVLFGSFRWGEDVSDSDIDIAIEIENIKGYSSLKLPQEFEKILGMKVQIYLFNRHSVDINVFNNIANGIVLSGFLEVRP